MLLPRYYHLTCSEFTDFRVYYWLPDFYCRSLNPVEAIEGKRNHGQVLGETKMPVINGIKYCNVLMLEFFGTFSMFIHNLILNDWRRESFCCSHPGLTTK